MIHHLALCAADVEKSARFYDAILGLLGYRRSHATDDFAAWEGPEPEILLYASPEDQRLNRHRIYDPGIHHVCFRVADRGQVDEAARVAANFGPLLDAPQAYPDYSDGYYATYFNDPDGIKIEFMTD